MGIFIKKIFNLLKEKFVEFKNYIKNDKFSFKKFLLLLGSGLLINFFSGFLSLILIITSGLYLVVKGVIPTIKIAGTKIIDFVKKTGYKFKELTKFKSFKKFNLFKQKKKSVTNKEKSSNVIKNLKSFCTNKFNSFKKKNKATQTEDKIETETTKEVDKTKKEDIPNIIKNLKLFCTNKLNFNLKIKKDVNGCKIVNGSYRIKGNQIIDNKINLYNLEPIIENETEYSHKTYVKTKKT